MSNNKFLCAFMALTVFFTNTIVAFAEQNTNAYTTMYFVDADEYDVKKNTTDNCLGLATEGQYVLYKNVDFGEDTAEFIDVTYGVREGFAGGMLNVYIDSMTESNLRATIISVSTSGWTNFMPSHTQLSQGITGVHDVYFKVTSTRFGNLRSFVFTNDSAETEEAAKKFIEKINAGQYSDAFSLYADILKIDTSEFAGEEDFIYAYIGANAPYTGFSVFEVYFTEACLLMNINKAETTDKIKSLIQNNSDLLAEAYSEFKKRYNNIEQDDVCAVVLDLLKDKKVNSKSEFADVFDKAVGQVLYSQCDSSEQLGRFLGDFDEYLSIDKYSDFVHMSEKSQGLILDSIIAFNDANGARLETLNDAFFDAYNAEVKRLETELRSAYHEFSLIDADYITGGLQKNTQFSCISNTTNGQYIQIDELNFGTVGARALDFTYGANAQYNGIIRIYVDSISDANEIASFTTKSTGGWHNWGTVVLPLSRLITGVHSVYVWFGGVVGDVKSMQFHTSKVLNVGDVQLKLYKSNAETGNIAEADKISASSSIEVINDGLAKASIIANVYNSNMTPLMNYMVSSQTLQSGIENVINLEKELDDGIAPQIANAFIIDSLFVTYGKPAYFGTYLFEKNTSEKPIDVKVSDTKISVFGNINSEYSVVGVREKSSNRADFENYSFIYSVQNDDNSYSVTFEAPVSMKSGEYTAVVFDGTGNFDEIDFDFIAESDIKSALAEINEAKASEEETLWQAIKRIAEANERFLGIDTSAADLMPEWVYTNLGKGIPYEKLSAFQENFGFFTALSAISQSDDAEKVIDENLEVLGISLDNCAEKYRKNKMIKSGIAKRVAAALKKSLTNTKSEFLKLYRLSACFEVMHNAVSWGEIDEVFSDFNGDLTLSSYNSYKNMSSDKKAQVCRALLNLSESELSADGIRNKFESAYKSAQAADNSGGKTSSGGGGGGGGGSSFTVKEPLPKTDEEENPVKFMDIDDCTWAKKQIIEFYKNGFINGKSEESFCPYDNVTRAEFIKILCLSLGISADGNCSFSDLSKDDWSYPYICAAYNKGIVGGYEDGSVRGASSITREEMAVMAYRAALISGISLEQVLSGVSFIDGEKISFWAYEAVMGLARSDILHGMGGDLFFPEKLAGRAETVVFLSNLRAAGDFDMESKN